MRSRFRNSYGLRVRFDWPRGRWGTTLAPSTGETLEHMVQSVTDLIKRRRFLQVSAALAGAAAVGRAKAADPVPVRVVSNGGVENTTLLELLERRGFLREAGVAQTLVTVNAPPATLEALVSDKADVCIVSGFNGLLPAIEKGAPAKVVGAALQSPALAVYASKPDIRTIADLKGRTIGIGPDLGLLHVAVIALMKQKGVDPASVRFVNVGSNADVYRDVKAGKVDAGPSDVSNIQDAEGSGLQVLSDGKMWMELKSYPYQLAYASDRALRDNREGVVRALAAYGKLFRFMSSASSFDAYAEARKAAGGAGEASARAAWNYVQSAQPYAGTPETTRERLDFLQNLHLSLGIQKAVLPIEKIADLTVARDAVKLI